MSTATSLKTFIIYARADEAFKNQLLRHLRPLRSVSVWHDGNILPGEEWDAAIKRELRASELVLFLVSADSLNSDYIQSQELKTALEMLRQGQARLVPVVVAPCAWRFDPILSGLQALPLYGSEGVKPVRSWADPDEAWAGVVERLGDMAAELQRQRAQAEARDAGAQNPKKPDDPPARPQPKRKSAPPPSTPEPLPPRPARGFFSVKNLAAGFAVVLLGFFAARYFWPNAGPPDNFKHIPAGTFQMGGTDGSDDEKPPHSVTLREFYLSATEVTVAEFKTFVDATGYRTDAEKEGKSWGYDPAAKKWDDIAGRHWRHDPEGNPAPGNHPVIYVSWNDATAYCAWLSKKEGRAYRLPTEAEWEYAAGNGAVHTRYSWGNGDPAGKKGGNVADESGKKKFPDWPIFGGYDDGYVFTAPVGSFDANDFGLYDMTGNVWEWCSDWYGSEYYKNGPKSKLTGPSSGSYRVARGGSWDRSTPGCRVANRGGWGPADRNNYLGFRLAASSPQ